MDDLKLFSSDRFGQVRTVVINGQVMFAATDVAKCLGYSNPNDAIIRHCKSDGVAFCEGVVKTGQRKDGTTYEQTGEIKVITKGNLVRLVANSELPQAEQVESWIFDEVIPQVLETGGYLSTNQYDTPEEIMSRALIIAQNTIAKRDERLQFLKKELEHKDAQLSALLPKAAFADCFLSCKGDITIGDMANILNQSNLFSKGKNSLSGWLRNNGYLIKRGVRRNKPTQKSMNDRLMRLATTFSPHDSSVLKEEVMVTSRGQKHFITRFRALLSAKESYEIDW